jgi:uncharacterized membrane protein (DUF485 family)
MRRMNRKLMSYFVAIMLVVFNTVYVSSANAAYTDQHMNTPTAGTMLADTVLVRVPMMAATAVGVVTFVVTLPFSALGGNVQQAGQILVVDPAEYTFVRPLGVF